MVQYRKHDKSNVIHSNSSFKMRFGGIENYQIPVDYKTGKYKTCYDIESPCMISFFRDRADIKENILRNRKPIIKEED